MNTIRRNVRRARPPEVSAKRRQSSSDGVESSSEVSLDSMSFGGDSITTDHISPAGKITKNSPAGRYLLARGVEAKDFNSYGSRRGNVNV